MTRPWKCRIALVAAIAAVMPFVGCAEKPVVYGRESMLLLPSKKRQIWAVAPAINLSGQGGVDPLLQADLAFEQLQQVGGLTVIPVNRVAQVYVALGIENVQSAEQAAQICDVLGVDGLVVPTITIYDPYNPPKFGGALQLFRKAVPAAPVAGRGQLADGEAQEAAADLPAPVTMTQAVGMYDAANGTVRDALIAYANGRHDPVGPLGAKEYLVSMDRFCGFAYRSLAESLLYEMRKVR